MRVSFCTTCMGRAQHVAATLPKNMRDNPGAEFVLLDYNSRDGLENWVMANLKEEIKSKRLVYVMERTRLKFNPRHAKNVAHLCASGDVLVNLDADNFTGAGYAGHIAAVMAKAGVFVRAARSVYSRKGPMTGIAGRISLRRDDFLALRGYDETCHGYGGDDPDLVRRAHEMGLQKVEVEWPGEDVIPHSNADRVVNFENPIPVEQSGYLNKMVWENRKVTDVVNPNGFGVAAVINALSGDCLNVGVGP